jgi:hypothetical protein
MLPVILAAVLSLPLAGDRSIGWNVVVAGATEARTAVAPSADDDFESAAISWSAASESRVMIRTSADALRWTDWMKPALDEDSTIRSEGRYRTAIIHFGSAQRGIELQFDTHAERVMLTLFPPSREHSVDRVATNSYQIGSLNIRSRTDWGCPDGEGARWTPAYTTVTHAVVHHTAGANSVPDWEAEIRSIWYLHTVTNAWGDIGYNFLIDPNGVIYEGRAGGDGAIGAHFSCRNSNTVGVSLLGTYTSVLPTAAAMSSLESLLRELCKRLHIDPTAIVLHVPTGLTLPTIIGHRDGNGAGCTITECPGNALYAALPAIRTTVACDPAAIESQPATVAVEAHAPAAISVKASGSEPLSYQWYAGAAGSTNAPIAGATQSTVTVSPDVTSRYWVRVTNACGTADSDTAVVYIGPQPPRRRAARP